MLRLMLPFSLPAASSVMNLPTAHQVQAIVAGQAIHIQAGGETVLPLTEAGTAAGAGEFPLLTALWLIGVLAAGAWFLFVNLRFARKLRTLGRPLAVDCPLPVYQVMGLSSPCLFGLLHPAIYVPAEVTGDAAMMRHILVHEECHWRQKDHIWALVRTVCLCLYWFDPLVWAAAAVSREDCEQACDERAVGMLGEPERIAYGHTLVSVVRRMRRPVYPGCTATTMSTGRHGLQRRIALIVSGTRTRRWAVIALAVCVVVLVGCTFTGRKSDSDQTLTELVTGTNSTAAFNPYRVTFGSGSEPQTPAFDLQLLLPDSWEVRSALQEDAKSETASLGGAFDSMLSPMEIYNGDVLVGTVRYSRYTPYDEESLPPEEEYKTVYPQLRLSSVDIWDPYTAVNRYDQGESGIAEVLYKDSAYIQAHPNESMAAVPEIQTKGLLCFNRELGVYIALRFEPDQLPNADDLNLIAESLRIEPAEES